MRILFMGTPDFAVESLRAIHANVCVVVTAPDKPKGRGMKLCPTPVKACAMEYGIPVFQPETLKNGGIASVLEEYHPDVIVVVAYGKILPEEVLVYPKYGCINVHGSLLPKYRGAAPIQRAVLNGERITGVCTMYMDKGLDTGDVILRQETEIGEYETAEELFDRLAGMGAELLVETLRQIEAGCAPRTKQNDAESTYAAMIRKEDARIDWRAPAQAIIHLIYGSNSWPIAFTTAQGKTLKIYRAVHGGTTQAAPGTVIALDEAGLEVACGDQTSIVISEFQTEGARRMAPADYFRGHPSWVGEQLG